MFDMYSYLIKSCIDMDQELIILESLTSNENKNRILKIIKNEAYKNIYSNHEIFLLMLKDVNKFLKFGYSCYKAVFITRTKFKNEQIFYLLEEKYQNRFFELAVLIKKIKRNQYKKDYKL